MISELKHGLFKYDVKDYYAILGVPVDSSPRDIRLRYLKIAYRLHPDTCTAQTPAEKKQASQILSKLVNPAYENLYQDSLRRECELIVSATARKLAENSSKITIATETARALYQEEKNLQKRYHEFVAKFAGEQYQDLHLITKKIALLSELNMVYLMLLKEAEQQAIFGEKKDRAVVSNGEPAIVIPGRPPQPNGETQEKPSSDSSLSRVERLLASARQHQQDSNWEQGILDLREALKIEPNNSTCHALIGSLYLKDGNVPYGRIHIKKAEELNPKDPFVQKSKEQLDNLDRKASSQGKKGIAKSAPKAKETKDKKQVPKIFGIPLW